VNAPPSTGGQKGSWVEQEGTGAGEDDADDSAVERARDVGGTAVQEAKGVIQEAGDQVREVAEEARQQLGFLTRQAGDELRRQAEEQARRGAENLRTLGNQAEALADGRPEDAGPLADYVRDLGGRLTTWASRLEREGFQGVMGDVRTFARRRPMAFIGLSTLAGFAVTRVGKHLQSDGDSGRADGGYGQDRTDGSSDFGSMPSGSQLPPVRATYPRRDEIDDILVLEDDAVEAEPRRP
jgi:hypothetical protein